MLCTRSTTPYFSSKASGKALTTNARTQKGSHVACDVQGSDNTLWGLNEFGGGVSDQYIKSQRKGNHGKPFSYCQLQSTALLTRLFDFMPTDISNSSSPAPSPLLAGIPWVEHSRDNDSYSEHYHDYRSSL